MTSPRDLLSIGRFSRVCRLSVKALRHYDELGLLRPALVDPQSGYRYYSVSQASEAERIRLLRSLDMPLDEVLEVLRADDAARVRGLLESHRQRLAARIEDAQRMSDFLLRLIEDEEAVMSSYTIQTKQLAAQQVLSLRRHTELKRIGEVMGPAFGQLFAYLGRLGEAPAGPPLVLYHGEEFDESDIDLEIAVPVTRPLSGEGDLLGRELPAAEAICTLHAGPYDEISTAYRALGEWMERNGKAPAGPAREIYLVGPQQAPSPADYRTEVCWPITRRSE